MAIGAKQLIGRDVKSQCRPGMMPTQRFPGLGVTLRVVLSKLSVVWAALPLSDPAREQKRYLPAGGASGIE